MAVAVGQQRRFVRINKLTGSIYKAIESKELILPEDRCVQVLSVDSGGPPLGLQLVSDTLIPNNLSLKIWFVKANDTAEIDNQLAQLGPELTSTLVIFILKSGGTLETRNCLLEVNTTFWEAGLNFTRQCVVIAQDGSLQDEAAKLEGWVARLPTFYWVGALWWYLTSDGDRIKDMVHLPYKAILSVYAMYVQQVFMELLEKDFDLDSEMVTQGLLIYGNNGTTYQHAYTQQLRGSKWACIGDALTTKVGLTTFKTFPPMQSGPGQVTFHVSPSTNGLALEML
ncbi:hypothetical protein QQ045_024996 [Rhodiola kirilowii]